MDNNGQLTFSDDPLLLSSNEAFKHIEEGNFSDAVERIDSLLSENPDYPGLIEGYRTSKFWLNRTKELNSLIDGRNTADFLMKEWEIFEEYAEEKNMNHSKAYRAAMRHIFFKASEQYKIAFQQNEDPTSSYELLINLGRCFIHLEEYGSAIETLEYAHGTFKSNARLHSYLGEAYFHEKEIPKSLLNFREAFFIDPQEVDLNLIHATPILELVEQIKKEDIHISNIKEWLPVYGFLTDIFYVKRNISKSQVDTIKNEIYNLEINYQKMNSDDIKISPVLPRLINKYLWLLDYYEFQSYSFDTIAEIRERLCAIKPELFRGYFSEKKY